MSSGKSDATTTEPPATVPQSTDFCADDADVIIRAAGTIDFRAHKLILSLVSPIFKDMFTLPQPPPDTLGTLPHVDVQDSAKVWELILRTIYPILPNPTIGTLDDLESLLFAAQAYEMHYVIEAHKKAFENRAFILKDPLRLYAIACACGFEDQATHVARNAELVTITRRSDPSDLKGLAFGAYCRLVSFLVDRDIEWNRALDGSRVPEDASGVCRCPSTSAEPLYKDIKKHLRRAYLQTEEVYLEALEYRSCCRELGCGWGNCPFANLTLKKFIKSRIEERDKVCNGLQPTKWYHERATLRSNPLIDIIFIRFT